MIKKTRVMGILNVTPDSFSDGGFFFTPENAIRRASELVRDGADIIDIGAESTRPGFTPIDAAEEISRLEKIIPAIKNFGVPVSIDTYKPEVAEIALKLGADMINDVSGLKNLQMPDVAKKYDCPLVVMHNEKNFCENIIDDVKIFFRKTFETCRISGFDCSKIIFDPGIGFGKTQEENLIVLKNLRELKNLDGAEIPLLLGVSRKSVIGYATGLDVDERDEATGAICVLAISQGVDIVRVHNVKLISKMCLTADALIRRY